MRKLMIAALLLLALSLVGCWSPFFDAQVYPPAPEVIHVHNGYDCPVCGEDYAYMSRGLPTIFYCENDHAWRWEQ